jgi:heat shock protein HtpX
MKIALYHTATWAALAASIALCPSWQVALGVAVCASIYSFAGHRLWEEYTGKTLNRYPDVQRFSPHLGEIAARLYQASGLSAQDHPIYDVRARPYEGKNVFLKYGLKWWNYAGWSAFGAGDYNAYATNAGKPVIMISEPLLKLLDDDEEEAILAHEFGHVVANDCRYGFFQITAARCAIAMNVLTGAWALAMTGPRGVFSGIAIFMASFLAYRYLYLTGLRLMGRPFVFRGSRLGNEVRLVRILIAGALTIYGIASCLLLGGFFHAYGAYISAALGLSVAAALFTAAYSQNREYRADQNALALGAAPVALITALRKIRTARHKIFTSAESHEKSIFTKAFSTHPPFGLRLERIAAAARQRGVSKELVTKAMTMPVDLPPNPAPPPEGVWNMARNL